MTIDKKYILPAVVVLGLVVGFWLGSSPASPVNPNPPQPIKRALATVIRTGARLALWVTVFGSKATPPEPQQIVRAPAVDADGHRVINHGEGW